MEAHEIHRCPKCGHQSDTWSFFCKNELYGKAVVSDHGKKMESKEVEDRGSRFIIFCLSCEEKVRLSQETFVATVEKEEVRA